MKIKKFLMITIMCFASLVGFSMEADASVLLQKNNNGNTWYMDETSAVILQEHSSRKFAANLYYVDRDGSTSRAFTVYYKYSEPENASYSEDDNNWYLLPWKRKSNVEDVLVKGFVSAKKYLWPNETSL